LLFWAIIRRNVPGRNTQERSSHNLFLFGSSCAEASGRDDKKKDAMSLHEPPSKRTLAVLSLLLLIHGLFTHWGQFSDGPAGMHLWTQSDHYALASGFVENGLDFFKPQTFVCHYQYPDAWDEHGQTLVTAVDFPIHNYIPAVVMKITGSDSPAIFSGYLLLISVTGLIFLFRLAYLFNRSVVLSLLIVVFIACTPVYSFYQIRFIPSVPSLSTAIIGLYYGFSYRKNGNFRHFVLATAFLSLAALTRMTFLIPLFAWLGQEFLFFLREKNDRSKKIVTVLLCLGAISGYTLYNHYLRLTYGGIFLNTIMPAGSWSQFGEVLLYIARMWKFEYISKVHYVVLFAMIVLLAYRFFRKNQRREYMKARWFVLFSVSGSIAFFLLMCIQFMAHDYYALDVFFVPLIILLCMASERLSPEKPTGRKWLAGFAILAVPAILWANHVAQIGRIELERWGLNAMVVRNFRDSKPFIDSLHIPRNEKLVVIDPLPRNVPFYYMERTGYVVMRNNAADLKDILNKPMRYYVFQNETFLSDICRVYPGIIRYLEIVGTNGKITVCRKTGTPAQHSGDPNKTLFEFLQLNDRKPSFHARLNERELKKWEVTGEKTAGNNAFAVRAESDFGPVIKLYDPKLFTQPRILFFRGQIRWDKQKDIQFVISLTGDGELKSYRTFSLIDATGSTNEWRDFRFLYTVPAAKSNAVDLSVYIWNTEHVPYKVRDVEMRLY
jgi:hypothetical protein